MSVDAAPPEIPGFRVERSLGSGAHGRVFLAREAGGLERRCALKVFAPWARERYEHERTMHARLEEMRRKAGAPEVVTALASGTARTAEGEVGWLALEWCEGGSLADRAAREGKIPWEDVRRLGAQAGRALARLHQEGLFHRDVKPANLLVRGDGRLLLADMGLARPLSGTLSAAGSPAFAAPEVIAGRVHDGRSADVYSLAATLSFLASGETVLPGRPDVFALERAGVPREAQRALSRALAADPAERTATVEALVEALEANPQVAVVTGDAENQGIRRGAARGPDEVGTGANETPASTTERSPEAMSAQPHLSTPHAAPSIQPLLAPSRVSKRAVASLVSALGVWPAAIFVFVIPVLFLGTARRDEALQAAESAKQRAQQADQPLTFRYGVAASALSPDGKQIAVTLKEGRLGFLDTETRRTIVEVLPFGADAKLSSVAWSPDGARIAVGEARGEDGEEGPRTAILDARGALVRTLRPVRKMYGGPAIFAPGGQLVAFPGLWDGQVPPRVSLFDLATTVTPHAHEVADPPSDAASARPIAFSPDGERLLVECRGPQIVDVVRGTSERLNPPGEDWYVQAGCFLEGGRVALSAVQDHKVHLDTFRLDDHTRRSSVLVGVGGVLAMRPVPGRDVIAAITIDGRLLDLDVPALMPRGEPVSLFPEARNLIAAEFSVDGRRVAAWSGGLTATTLRIATVPDASERATSERGVPLWVPFLAAVPLALELLAIGLAVSALMAIGASRGALWGRGFAIAALVFVVLNLCAVLPAAALTMRSAAFPR